MTPIEHFQIDLIQLLVRDWIENKIPDIGLCNAATDIFQPTLCNFFYKCWPIIIFYGRDSIFVRCCRKNLQWRSPRFFRSSTIEVVFRPTPPCFQLVGRENVSQPREKNLNHRYWSKKILADVGKERWDRGLQKNHRVTLIEHFLIDIIQILFRDWIENTITDIGRCKVVTDIFQPILCNFFYKRRPIIFFYGRGYFFVRCCRKNLHCRSARFFLSSSTKVVFRPTPACFHLLGMEKINHHPQKNMIPRYW